MERYPNTQYVLSLSYGKDSLACLAVIDELCLPLDRIIHAEVWATQDIPADLPPMIEFKKKADKIIKERWGIDVEHICAMRGDAKLTYENIFYRPVNNSKSKIRSQKIQAEREREREHGVRIPDATRELVHRRTQETLPYGFPIATSRGSWCSALKTKPITSRDFLGGRELGVRTDSRETNSTRLQNAIHFWASPKNEGQRQISFSISE